MSKNRKTSVALLKRCSFYPICLWFICMYLTMAIDIWVTSASRSFNKSPNVQALSPSVDYLCFSSKCLGPRIKKNGLPVYFRVLINQIGVGSQNSECERWLYRGFLS